MLFKNLKSGNFVEAKDSSTIELMKDSPIYEAAVVPAPAPVVEAEAEKPVKKSARGAKK